MGQIKMGIKMLRYTFGIKTCLISMLLFVAIGALGFCLPVKIAGRMAGFFILMGSLWVTQLIFSLNVSHMVQASPWKRALQTSVPALISLIYSLILYGVVAALCAFRSHGASPEEGQILVAALLMNGILAFLLQVYSGAAYKYFIAATVGFFVAIYVFTGVFSAVSTMGGFPSLSFAGAAGIGVLCVIAGALAEYGLSMLFYKAPVSKMAQMRRLQKYM